MAWTYLTTSLVQPGPSQEVSDSLVITKSKPFFEGDPSFFGFLYKT